MSTAPLAEYDEDVRLYSTGQVAELCGVTSETVRDWLERGELRGFKLGNQFRVRKRDLRAYINRKYGEHNGEEPADG